jgi:DNA helicase-2/ATP-dependent DNA helicase PcrA
MDLVAKHLNVRIQGQVQGVFFRVKAKEVADELGVKGIQSGTSRMGASTSKRKVFDESLRNLRPGYAYRPPRARVREVLHRGRRMGWLRGLQKDSEHLLMTFEEAYNNLNPRQKEAVDTIEGPVMVIAGPGTGKTQILTLRIANIIQKTDTAPENILALTFTESAAANMRKRLVDMIGTRGYYVEIATFHGFANRLIQEFPEYFPAIIGAQNATDIDQLSIIRGIIEGSDFELLKPFGDKFFYVNDILGAIRDVKREGYDPESFAKLLKKREKEFNAIPDLYHDKGAHEGKMKLDYQKRLRDLQKNAELAKIYERYEAELRMRRLYDFEDMILEVNRALDRNKNFLLEVQEEAQYILVDEHQDTNGAQTGSSSL